MSSSPVRRVESRSVVEQAAHEIRRSIISGSLAPGQEFALREIAGHLGVSFIPVREALRTLEYEGLVTMRPGRSAVVSPVNREDLRAIYQLRRNLEPEIASRSCLLLNPAVLDDLERRASRFGGPDAGVDEIYDDHQSLHLALLAPAASHWDVRILTILWRAAERYIRLGFGRLDPQPHEHHRRVDAHLDVLEAFRGRDPEVVRAAVMEHLRTNEALALRSLEEMEAGAPPAASSTG
jgi:DNA-binding GntR family transcriptional regulator